MISFWENMSGFFAVEKLFGASIYFLHSGPFIENASPGKGWRGKEVSQTSFWLRGSLLSNDSGMARSFVRNRRHQVQPSMQDPVKISTIVLQVSERLFP